MFDFPRFRELQELVHSDQAMLLRSTVKLLGTLQQVYHIRSHVQRRHRRSRRAEVAHYQHRNAPALVSVVAPQGRKAMYLAHAGRIPIQIPVHEVSMAFIESLRLALYTMAKTAPAGLPCAVTKHL
jgi:hypothetical protein